MKNNNIIFFNRAKKRKEKYEFAFTIDISILKCEESNKFTTDCIYPHGISQMKVIKILIGILQSYKGETKIPIRDCIGKRFSISYYEKNVNDYKLIVSPNINKEIMIAIISIVLNDFGLKIGSISS